MCDKGNAISWSQAARSLNKGGLGKWGLGSYNPNQASRSSFCPILDYDRLYKREKVMCEGGKKKNKNTQYFLMWFHPYRQVVHQQSVFLVAINRVSSIQQLLSYI